MSKPHKVYLYRYVTRYLADRQFGTALDLACGDMAVAPLIRSKHYIGVDIDEARLVAARACNPGREGVVGAIESLDPSLSGDLVICLQMIGTNRFAEASLIPAYVASIVRAARPGGAAIVDIGTGGREHFAGVETELKRAFRSVSVLPYGRFRQKRPAWLCRVLVWAMETWPHVAESNASPSRLFIAEGRI